MSTRPRDISCELVVYSESLGDIAAVMEVVGG